MKPSFLSFLSACVALALPASVLGATNKEVIKMQKAGFSEETILAAIEKEKPDFDTSADALIELKEAGVSEKLIQRMIALQGGGATASVAPAATDSPASDSAASPVFLQNFPSIAPPLVAPIAGQDYFTRFTLHQEDNDYSTTNYSRGTLVPINTPVRLVSLGGKQMVLRRLDTNQELKIKNEEKYTNKSVAEFAKLMLSTEATPLNKLPQEVATAILSGEMRKGMTKELVLMARGYPPAHETPSLEGDRWVYWSSRFVKLTVIFRDDRLTEGRGLY